MTRKCVWTSYSVSDHKTVISLLWACFVLAVTAPASAQSINVVVSNIPPAATAVNVAVDGTGIATTNGVLPGVQQATNGNTTTSVLLSLPVGGPYRVRVIATGTSSIQRTGKATGIQVIQSGTITVPITLGDISAHLDASSPSAGEPGRKVAIVIDASDPGDWLEGSQGDLNFTGSVTPFTINGQGTPNGGGTLSSLGNGQYQLSFTPTLPISGNQYYFQIYTLNFRWEQTTFARF